MMQKLESAVKLFIVGHNACYREPREVVRMVKDEFDIVITPAVVQTYDPTRVAGRKLAKKYQELFARVREAFINEEIDIPIAHKAFRLAALNDMHGTAQTTKFKLMILEQAAKETANHYARPNTTINANASVETNEYFVEGGLPDEPLGNFGSDAEREAALAVARERQRFYNASRNAGQFADEDMKPAPPSTLDAAAGLLDPTPEPASELFSDPEPLPDPTPETSPEHLASEQAKEIEKVEQKASESANTIIGTLPPLPPNFGG